jgi:hypothetical protein
MMIIKVITVVVVVERERDLGRIRRGCCLRFLVFRIQADKKITWLSDVLSYCSARIYKLLTQLTLFAFIHSFLFFFVVCVCVCVQCVQIWSILKIIL